MHGSIHFSAWHDDETVPELCSLCKGEFPIFQVRIAPAHDNDPERVDYCCLRCGQQLLASAEQLILEHWDSSERTRAAKSKRIESSLA
jgi:hypothetical protein